MEKVGLQQHKENNCPYPPISKPLPFNKAGANESPILNSQKSVSNQENISLRSKEKQMKKISVLRFLQQRRQQRNQQKFNVQKKIFIK